MLVGASGQPGLLGKDQHVYAVSLIPRKGFMHGPVHMDEEVNISGLKSRAEKPAVRTSIMTMFAPCSAPSKPSKIWSAPVVTFTA